MNNIKIRQATIEDVVEIKKLYYETVTTVNAKDYTPQQIQSWIKPFLETDTTTSDKRKFSDKIIEQYFIVAIIDNVITGFASVEDNGYLDFMYVHKDFQRHGVAKTLLTELERYTTEKNIQELNAIVSKTALGFFQKFGWIKIREEEVEVRGATFIDNIMIKRLI